MSLSKNLARANWKWRVTRSERWRLVLAGDFVMCRSINDQVHLSALGNIQLGGRQYFAYRSEGIQGRPGPYDEVVFGWPCEMLSMDVLRARSYMASMTESCFPRAPACTVVSLFRASAV